MLGNFNQVFGSSNTLNGHENKVKGDNNALVGNLNQVIGSSNTLQGNENKVKGN